MRRRTSDPRIDPREVSPPRRRRYAGDCAGPARRGTSEARRYPLLMAGLSNREIAAAPGIELSAANARVNRVCQVYGVTTVRRLLARRIAELEAGRGEPPGA
jgi:hypothetical protein